MGDGKVSKEDMGREGRLERLAELGGSRLLHNLEDCAIRWEIIYKQEEYHKDITICWYYQSLQQGWWASC